MERDYDLFEQLSGASRLWRGQARGLLDARRQLLDLSKITNNECFAIDLVTREIAARVNVHTAEGKKPFVVQITYDESLAQQRSRFLRLQGYLILTVVGNQAAKALLASPRRYDLLIIGHGPDDEARREMVAWLKKHCPYIPIIAVNASARLQLAGADYNVKLNGPEILLPVMTAALSRGRGGISAAG